jgi:curved DNA-binding protein CbpA
VSATFDPYKTLQVDSEAEPDVIQAAYRRLASRFHPDLGGGTEAAERMVALNRAWEILSDPSRRAAYDAARAAAARRDGAGQGLSGAPQPAASPEYRRRAGSPDGGGTANVRGGSSPPRPGSADGDGLGTFTSGRSTVGGGYDPATMGAPDGTAAAGPPPGDPSGPVLNFGRYSGWSLGEIARRDAEYLEWLDRMPIGRPYRDAIEGILRRLGRRGSARAEADARRGLFRRR